MVGLKRRGKMNKQMSFIGMCVLLCAIVVNAAPISVNHMWMCPVPRSHDQASPYTSSTVVLGTDDFTVLAGGRLSTSKQVSITGNVGAGSNIWFNQQSSVTGSIYTGGKFSAGSRFSVSNRILAAGNVSIGENANLLSIDTKGTMYIGSNSRVGDLNAKGNLSLSKYVTVNGNVVSNNRVYVNRHSVIHGNLTYGTSYWLNSQSTVDGNISQGSASVDVWSPVKRDKPGFTSGSDNIHYQKDTDNTLLPGNYRSLVACKNATVRLTAGTYNLGRIWLDKDVQLIADTSEGDVLVNIANSATAGKDVKFQTLGSGQLTLQASHNIALSENVLAQANLISFGNLTISSDSQITGQLYADNNIYLGKGVQVTGCCGTPVPEPATIGLLLIGFYVVRKKRRVVM